MLLPLSALLYKITQICDYELQNVNTALSFEDIHLFETALDLSTEKNHLFFLSDDMFMQMDSTSIKTDPDANTVFLCYLNGSVEKIRTEHADLSVVYLIPKHGESFPSVFNRFMMIIREFGTWDQVFHVELLHGASMQQLLDITTPILSHSMIVLDRHRNIIGSVKKENDIFMNEFLEDGCVSETRLKSMHTSGNFLFNFRSEFLNIFPYKSPEGKKHFSMCYRLTDSSNLYGYVLIFCCNNHPSVSYQYLMDMVIQNLILYFQQSPSYAHKGTEQYELVLSGVMDDPDISVHKLTTLLEDTDLTFKGNFLLARVYFTDNENTSRSFVSWNIKTSFPLLKPFVHHNTLYLLYCAVSQNDVLNAFIPEEKNSQFLYSFSGWLRHCTVSKPFYSLDKLSQAAKQCEIAHDYLPNEKDSAQLVYYKDCAFNYLQHEILSLNDHTFLNSQYYEALKTYDEEHGTKLCYILYEYLIHFKSINTTAEACYLHRNTVLNSIKKAFSIIGNHLDNYDDTLFFILSYRIDK